MSVPISFYTFGLFLYLLKTENQIFFDDFRGVERD